MLFSFGLIELSAYEFVFLFFTVESFLRDSKYQFVITVWLGYAFPLNILFICFCLIFTGEVISARRPVSML